jgi:hypothetical protein
MIIITHLQRLIHKNISKLFTNKIKTNEHVFVEF